MQESKRILSAYFMHISAKQAAKKKQNANAFVNEIEKFGNDTTREIQEEIDAYLADLYVLYGIRKNIKRF